MSVLSNRNFLLLWIGQIVSNVGDAVAFLGIAAVVLYQQGGGPLEAGGFLVAAALPMLLVGPIAGVYVDRWSRRRTMIAADVIRAVLVLLFIFTASPWEIYIIVFAVSTVSRFFYPARSAIIPEIVGRDELVEANSLSQMTFMLSSIMGPAIGAVVIGFMGTVFAFVFDSLTFIASALFIGLITIRESRRPRRRRKTGAEILTGLRIMFRSRRIGFLSRLLVLITVVMGGINLLYFLYVRDVLGMDVTALGMLEMFYGAGAVLGGVGAARVSRALGRGTSMGLSGVLMALSLASMSFLPLFWVAAAAMLLVGVGSIIFTSIFNAHIQASVEARDRGKVFGVMGAVIQGCMIISLIVHGFILEWIDLLLLLRIDAVYFALVSAGFLLSRYRAEMDAPVPGQEGE